ncbi:MAG: Cyclopropane-fatty-acyl-phospholipid synthase [Thermoleophilia bacterium]|nr:Cyclopropane-fatty-acyl-phospholipid synthase [Thermoleophilia bacterium]
MTYTRTAPTADDGGVAPLPVTEHPERLVPIPTPRARLRASGFRRLLLPRMLRAVDGGHLDLALPDGSNLAGGDPEAPLRGRIEVLDERAFEQVAARGQRGFGEAFVLDQWTSPDPALPLEVLARSVAAAGNRGVLGFLRRAQRLLPAWQRSNGLRSAKRHIAYHYDLGNDFFECFLDASMTYSCAMFEDGDGDLLQAQLTKYERICEQLEITAADHVLEIGCGWGGFAEHVARTRGAKVTAVTISERQHEYAVQRIRAAGLDHLVDVQLRDYRLVEGTFSRIVSIEMLEAVGAKEYPRFFRTLDARLAPEGRALVQVIAFQDRDYARQLRSKGWIRRYVFPGGMLPTQTVLTRTMTRSTTLQLHELREIGQHYGPTLRAWRERLLAAEAELEARGYGRRLRRSWEYYFAYCEAGFRAGHIRVLQAQVTRAGTVVG